MGQTVLEPEDVLEWAAGSRHCTSVSRGASVVGSRGRGSWPT